MNKNNKMNSFRTLIEEANIIDLTHKITNDMPIMPFQKAPTIETIIDYSQGALVRRFSIDEHEGTHIDAPAHFIAGGLTVDRLNIKSLFSHAYILDVREEIKKDCDYKLSVENLESFEGNNNLSINGGVILMWTGWSANWRNHGAYFGIDDSGATHFPGFSREVVELLVEEKGVVGIGIDGPSVDSGTDKGYSVHSYVLSKGLFQMENLTNLEQIGNPLTQLMIAPMHLFEGSGAPARVFAFSF